MSTLAYVLNMYRTEMDLYMLRMPFFPKVKKLEFPAILYFHFIVIIIIKIVLHHFLPNDKCLYFLAFSFLILQVHGGFEKGNIYLLIILFSLIFSLTVSRSFIIHIF